MLFGLKHLFGVRQFARDQKFGQLGQSTLGTAIARGFGQFYVFVSDLDVVNFLDIHFALETFPFAH
jgi:hypothetical protein